MISYISLDDMLDCNATKEDTEGIVQILNEVIGINVAVFIYQMDRNNYKVSLRSKGNVNVCDIAKDFGGGGFK